MIKQTITVLIVSLSMSSVFAAGTVNVIIAGSMQPKT